MKKLFLLPFVAMFGLVGCGGDNPGGGEGGGGEAKTITLTAQTLMGYSGTNIAYDTQYKTNTVDGVEFAYQQMGAYGSGIQFRNKLSDETNGTKSNLYNTAAIAGTISSIDLVWNDGKQVFDNTNMLKITLDTVSSFEGASKEVQMLNTVKDQKSYSVSTNGVFNFVKIEIDDAFTYSCYWESIVINYVG